MGERGVMQRDAEVEYPERDGKPMGESDEHANEMREFSVELLRDYFESQLDIYVSGNNMVYYTEGVLGDVISPDCYVVKGVPKRERRTYKAWEEGSRLPCFVLEITSKSTRREDLGDKMAIYRDFLRVPEYFIFDLWADWIPERLRAYALTLEGEYRKIVPDRAGRLASRELGLEVAEVGGHVRFFEPGAREPLPTRRERIQHERERVQRESERAQRAEAEVRELRERLARLEGGGE